MPSIPNDAQEALCPAETTVGVAGAGTIGRGVAQRLAQSGFQVALVDIEPDALAEAREEIRAASRAARLFGGNKSTTGDPLSRISFTTEPDCLSAARFVIENIPENPRLKADFYRQLDTICAARCIFAANTSAIPIAELGSATSRPDRMIGVHFMNPVLRISMVEMIPGPLTSDPTTAATGALLSAMGLQWVSVRDGFGFVSNRVMMLMVNEAIHLLDAGAASELEIDRLFRGCFGHPMGPLETADLIGLDTVLSTLLILERGLGDAKFRPANGLVRRVLEGRLGRKTGEGFRRYRPESRDQNVRPAVDD
jgi:3-hydroxybutyryl-CoA dehydrogenase